MPPKTYEFGEFRLDLAQKELRRNGEILTIQPKVFEVLQVLIEKNNQLVTRDELMDTVWADTFVEETNLRFCIHTLRKVIGKNYVETVPKRGYRFKANVRELNNNNQLAPDPSEKLTAISGNHSYRVNKGTNRSFRILPFAFAALLLLSVLAFLGFMRSNGQNSDHKMSLAVLPFTKVGDTPQLNLGATDAVIIQLSKLRDFRVLPVGAIQKFSSQQVTPQNVGNELGADTVLNCSFREENDSVHVTANLIRTNSGENIWSENFSIKKDDRIEASIAARLARLFSQKFVEYEDEKRARSTNVNPEALEAYLSARKIWRSRDLGRVPEMSSLLKRAIELEPKWAMAHSANAEALVTNDLQVTEFQFGEEQALKALELDKNQVGALTVLGQAALKRDWQPKKAEDYFRQALEIDPDYISAAHEYGVLLAEKRNFVESEKMIKRALEIEPFSPLFNASLCRTYYYDKKIDGAIEKCEFAMQLEPGFWLARKYLFWAYVYKKDDANVSKLVLDRHPYEKQGANADRRSLENWRLEDYWKDYFEKNASNGNSSHSYTDALAYMQLGDTNNALASIKKALENREGAYPSIIAEPIFEPLRDDARFINLVQILNESDAR